MSPPADADSRSSGSDPLARAPTRALRDRYPGLPQWLWWNWTWGFWLGVALNVLYAAFMGFVLALAVLAGPGLLRTPPGFLFLVFFLVLTLAQLVTWSEQNNSRNLMQYLRERHTEAWHDLGEPSMVRWTWQSHLCLIRSLVERGNLGDPALARLTERACRLRRLRIRVRIVFLTAVAAWLASWVVWCYAVGCHLR